MQDMSNQELCSRLLLLWGMKTYEVQYIDDTESDPISKIINHRTKSFNIKLPKELAYIISICSNGNPGMAIIIYYTLLKAIAERKDKMPKDGYTITIEDFGMAFPFSFPDINIPSQREKFEKLWDEQKDDNGHNKVDTLEYWNELFE